jgi:hypothetical protein
MTRSPVETTVAMSQVRVQHPMLVQLEQPGAASGSISLER